MLPLSQLWYQLFVDGRISIPLPDEINPNASEDSLNVCLKKGAITVLELTQALAGKYRMLVGEHLPAGNIHDLPDLLDLEEYRILRVFPFRKTDTSLDVFIDNPTNDAVFQVLESEFRAVHYLLISPQRMDSLWEGVSFEVQDVANIVDDSKAWNISIDTLFSESLESAIKANATDIHFEQKKNYTRVRCRIRGKLEEIQLLNRISGEHLITYIMQKAGMDASEPRKPQDGAFRVLNGGFPIEVRVSSIIGSAGISLVLRLLPVESKTPTISKLGLNRFQEDNCRNLLKLRDGMVLISGPTGSGKSTTLYSWLREMNTVERKLITIEDPVEIRLKGINQIQVNKRAGLGYADALKAVLRQSPDVILLGEIRDSETASLAVNAALSGHFLMSTVHSKNVFGVIDRMLDLAVDRMSLVTALQAVVSQRLIPMLCPNCREQTTDDFAENISADVPLYKKGKGCGYCLGTGYYKQTAVFEILVLDESLRREILEQGSLEYKDDYLMNYCSLESSLKEKLISGDIGIEDYWVHCE
jgi:type II secretory ATPase GspE/PulE/Tfp pilus assembly ATPase PilB-like protein